MLEHYLKTYFGYSSFRSGQKEVIEQLLLGKDVVALLPTGRGKSLCYQLAGYVLDAPVLIISPLLSLMQDQVDQLKRFGEKRVIALNSFLKLQQKKHALQSLQQYRFIFLSPEMLVQRQMVERLQSIRLSLIVVDEAHCLSQWGFDFRPDYLKIGEVFEQAERPPILALTATATEKVLLDIKSYLHMRQPFYLVDSVDRPNIYFDKKTFPTKQEKHEWLIAHVTSTIGPGIIYTQSRRKAEEISACLLQTDIQVAAYHAGKDAEDRQFIQHQFLNGALSWIVATNAFGMGVHKDNIRQVIHESMPSTIAHYMQEIGRAGRDGERSLATLLFVPGDDQVAKFVVTEDIPKKAHIEQYRFYQNSGQQPTKLMDNHELSDTAFRVLDYWMRQEPADQVQERFFQMEYAKIKEVDEVLSLIQTTSCMREFTVRYFGQNVATKPTSCCCNCHDNILESFQRVVFDKSYKSITWQQRLKNILSGH